MVRPLWLALALIGCADEAHPLAGEWVATLDCADLEPVDDLCGPLDVRGDDEPWIYLVLDEVDPPGGIHRALLSHNARPDGGYTGVSGFVGGHWQDGELSLELTADLSDPFLSSEDAVLWSERRLELTGQPGSICWAANWSWWGADLVLASGSAIFGRADADCGEAL